MMVFTQWDQLVALIARIAKTATDERSRYAFSRIDLSTGIATLKDRSVNLVELAGGAAELVVPDAEPGVAHDFVVRATCTAATELSFAGADFESDDDGALAAPDEGETVVYLFTETAPGVFLVSRKVVTMIGEE